VVVAVAIGPTSDTGEFANKLLAAALNGDVSGATSWPRWPYFRAYS